MILPDGSLRSRHFPFIPTLRRRGSQLRLADPVSPADRLVSNPPSYDRCTRPITESNTRLSACNHPPPQSAAKSQCSPRDRNTVANSTAQRTPLWNGGGAKLCNVLLQRVISSARTCSAPIGHPAISCSNAVCGSARPVPFRDKRFPRERYLAA